MKYNSTSESPFQNKTNQTRDSFRPTGEKPKGDDAKSREVIIEEELQALKKKLGIK
jgi:hypothetical protein